MHVSVISTPSFTKASIVRRSRSSIHGACLRNAALQKSVPRGSVIVGMQTWRSVTGWLAKPSSQATPASPRLSVSAMTCACVTRTKSGAPKNSPTLSWCCKASWRTDPISPASIACSRSQRRMSGMSVHRRARIAHGVSPFDELALLELRELVARVAAYRHTQRHQQRAKSLRTNDGVDFGVEPRRDGGRQICRREYAPPCGRFEVLETRLGERRRVGRRRRACLAAHGEELQSARAHLRQHRLEWI